MSGRPRVIAVDGPAASGKGTLARRLARHYGLAYLDTGSLYRAVAYEVLNQGKDPASEADAVAIARKLDPGRIDEAAIRTREVGAAASRVAAMPAVREAVLAFQRAFARRPGGAVLDGRDIGTVVCPEADIKLFVTASLEERTRRRYLELKRQGYDVTREEVKADLRQRDARDRERAASPLKQAEDAYLLDTSNLDIETAFAAAVEIIEGTGQGGAR